MSKRLEDLKPEVAEMAGAFLLAASTAGYRLVVTHTLRTLEEQGALYAKGRFGNPPPIVTHARPGYSWHNFGRAFDVAFVVDGKPSWRDDHPWEAIGMLGETLGLEWGGRWESFPDRPHFQYPGGRTLAQARASLGLTDDRG